MMCSGGWRQALQAGGHSAASILGATALTAGSRFPFRNTPSDSLGLCLQTSAADNAAAAAALSAGGIEVDPAKGRWEMRDEWAAAVQEVRQPAGLMGGPGSACGRKACPAMDAMDLAMVLHPFPACRRSRTAAAWRQ